MRGTITFCISLIVSALLISASASALTTRYPVSLTTIAGIATGLLENVRTVDGTVLNLTTEETSGAVNNTFGTTQTGNWLQSGCASANEHECVDDTPGLHDGNTTIVWVTANAQSSSYGADFGIETGTTIDSVQLFIVVRVNSSSATYETHLWDGATDCYSSSGSITMQGFYTLQSPTLSDCDGTPWTAEIVNGLLFEHLKSAGGTITVTAISLAITGESYEADMRFGFNIRGFNVSAIQYNCNGDDGWSLDGGSLICDGTNRTFDYSAAPGVLITVRLYVLTTGDNQTVFLDSFLLDGDDAAGDWVGQAMNVLWLVGFIILLIMGFMGALWIRRRRAGANGGV